MFDCEVAPPEYAPVSQCRPSGWLALELDTASATPATDDDAYLIEAVIAFDRLTSWAQARQAQVLAEFARRRPADTDPAALRSTVASSCGEFAADEVALALRLSRIAAGVRLEIASTLDTKLPETLTAWEHGFIDSAKVRAILDACRHLPTEHARAVQERVLARAPEQTQGQLRAALARAVIAIDPDAAEERRQQARHDRRVVLNPEPDAMASIWAFLPAPDAVAAYEHLGKLARDLGAADPRGMDARRADLLTDLLTGQRCAAAGRCGCDGGTSCNPGQGEGPGHGHCGPDHPGTTEEPNPTGCTPPRPSSPAKPTVHVTVPITTLMGLDDNPAELRGYGPIPAALAREIASEGTWRRLLTDPESGTLLDYGRTTYRPPTALADYIRARDTGCRSPICRRSATHADLDHTVAWANGGTTSEHNLYAGCRHDHLLKTHAPGWQVTQTPDGTVTYTTPTGHRYSSRPHDYRTDRLVPPGGTRNPDPPPEHDPDPPPF